jgi:2-iminobutanoate/2-iminopropanoate deaminase
MKSPNPYSYAIKTGDTLFLSGLVSRNGKDNSAVAGDIATQTRTVMENAGELLKAAGMTYDNIVQSRVFLPDGATFQQMNEIYRPYFKSDRPARATVQAALAGPQYQVEMTFVASTSKRTAINPGPNLSAAIVAGNRVYLSGALSSTASIAGKISDQTTEIVGALKKTLASAGCTPADVVDSIVYLTDAAMFADMNKAYGTLFYKDYPARATVQTGLVSQGSVVEIMLTAVKQ